MCRGQPLHHAAVPMLLLKDEASCRLLVYILALLIDVQAIFAEYPTEWPEIQAVLGFFEQIHYAFLDLKGKKVFRDWAELQETVFPYFRYLRKITRYMDDVEWLHRAAHSPRYREHFLKPIIVTPLSAVEKRGAFYPAEIVDHEAWTFTIDLAINHASHNLSADELPWCKRNATVARDIHMLRRRTSGKLNTPKRESYSAEEAHIEAVDNDELRGLNRLGRLVKLCSKTSGKGISFAKVPDRVHCELKVIIHILEQSDSRQCFTGIGVSKLSCRSCYVTIHALNDVCKFTFHVHGSQLKFLGNGKYPDFTTLNEEAKKAVAMATHQGISICMISRYKGVQTLRLSSDEPQPSSTRKSMDAATLEWVKQWINKEMKGFLAIHDEDVEMP